MKPRILILNNSDNHGGAAKAAFRLMLVLLENNYEVNMLVRDKKTNHPNVYSYLDFETKNIYFYFRKIIWKIKNRIRKQKWNDYPNRKNVFLNDLNSVSLIEYIHKFDFDVLNLHFISNRFLDLNELILIKKPIVWTLHDSWAFTGICHFTYDCENYEKSCGKCPMLESNNYKDFTNKIWRIKNEIYNQIDIKIISPSNWLALQAKKSSLLKYKTIEVIPNLINFEVFKISNKINAKKTLKLNINKKHIVFGAVNSTSDLNKGFDLLLKSLELIDVEVKNLLELVVYGNKGPEKNLSGIKTIYLGYINDEMQMSNVYNAADVVVVPSRSENLSNTILESMSCGSPVVAFNVGGNSDIIDHKINGYLAIPFDIKDFEIGILWCIQDKKSKELSENSILKINNNFSRNTFDKYHLFFNKCKSD